MSEVQQVAVGEVTSGWAELSEKVVDAAKEICGVRTKRVENPWMIGKDDRIVEEGEWGGDELQRYGGGGEGGARD